MSAAFRNHMHWSEFIGGDVVISPPHSRQVRFNASDVEARNRIDEPVDPKIVEDLSRKFADFRRAFTEGGIAIEDFNSFGATRRTLRQFVAACGDLDSLVRDFMLAYLGRGLRRGGHQYRKKRSSPKTPSRKVGKGRKAGEQKNQLEEKN